jgi:hypothetical protein
MALNSHMRIIAAIVNFYVWLKLQWKRLRQ